MGFYSGQGGGSWKKRLADGLSMVEVLGGGRHIGCSVTDTGVVLLGGIG